MKKELAQKVVKIIKEMKPLTKDTKAYNYSYATLKQIQDTLVPILGGHGILWTTPTSVEGGRNLVHSIIEDVETGESITSSMIMEDGLKAQEIGSAVTYFRRYTILALLNLETEDDDGAKAQGTTKKPTNTANDLDF